MNVRGIRRGGRAYPALAPVDPRPAADALAAGRGALRAARPARRSRSWVRARARRTAARWRGRSVGSWPRRGSSSSAAWPGGSTARPIAGRSTSDGITVAVLGCGIDRDYPAAHRDLARPHRREGADRLGVRAGHRACAVAISGAKQDHRRSLRGDRRRRGARALGSADHGGLRARGRTRGDGRARRDHLGRLGRVERVAPPRCDAGDRGCRRARGIRDRAAGRAAGSDRRARG